MCKSNHSIKTDYTIIIIITFHGFLMFSIIAGRCKIVQLISGLCPNDSAKLNYKHKRKEIKRQHKHRKKRPDKTKADKAKQPDEEPKDKEKRDEETEEGEKKDEKEESNIWSGGVPDEEKSRDDDFDEYLDQLFM